MGKRSKRQIGSAYTYIKNEEWLGPDKFGNFGVINALTSEVAAKFRPVITNINTNIEKMVRNNRNLDLIENVHKNNSNRKKIKQILSEDEANLIIKNVLELKNKLEDQVENINEILNKNLDVEEYYAFINDPSIKTKKFTFRNIDQAGDIPKNPKFLTDFGDKVIDFVTKMESPNIKNKIEKNEDHIKYSISCAMSWKYVDLTKHAIGTLEDIVNFSVTMLERMGETNIRMDENFLKKLYGSYILDSDWNEFILNISYHSYKVFDEETYIINPGATNVNKNELPSSKDVPKEEINFKHFRDVITDSLVKAQKTGLVADTAKEYLVVVIYDLMRQTINNLKNVADQFGEFQKRKYGNKYKTICNSIKNNLDAFYTLVQNAINTFFTLKNRSISAYGIDFGNRTTKGSPSLGKDKMLRVIGGASMIGNLAHMTFEYYPLNFEKGRGDVVNRLMNMIFDAPKNDIVSEKPLAIGGFILKDIIGKMSMRIVHDYFERLLKNKEHNIAYIEKILERMRRGVHITDLKDMRNKIENKVEEILKIKEKVSRDMRALTIIQYLAAEYKRYRTFELDNLLSLDLIETAIRDDPNKVAKEGKSVMRLRDEAFVKLGHYQLKSMLFRKMTLGIFQHLQKKGLSGEYYSKMQDAFDSVDSKVLSNLANKANQNRYNRLKNRLLSREISRNISVLNKSKITEVPIPTGMRSNITPLRPIENSNRTLSVRDYKKIEGKEFWQKAKTKLDGTTIYIPFVNLSAVELSAQHGLFDIINAAIEGKIKESTIITSIDDHIIYGSAINRQTISRRIRAKGQIMVANGENDIRDSRQWRCMLKREINEMKKLGTADLRIKIFNVIASKANYIMNTPYIWPAGSYTKEKIKEYCRLTFDKIDFYKCPLLTSRNRIARRLEQIL